MTSTFDPDKFIESINIRWPKKGDRLLCDSDDWDKSVDFAQNGVSRRVHQWHGYMFAGAVLVEACEKHPYERHGLIYPILFNYRHGLELAMKWIIDRYGRYCSGVEIGDTKGHELLKLWRVCKAIMIEIGGNDDAISTVEQIIKDFHDIDQSGSSFRYAYDKNNAQIDLPDKEINIEKIRYAMKGVDNFFMGANDQLDDYTSNFEPDFD